MACALTHTEIRMGLHGGPLHRGQVHLDPELEVCPLRVQDILHHGMHQECVVSRGGRGGRGISPRWVCIKVVPLSGVLIVKIHGISVVGPSTHMSGGRQVEVPYQPVGCASPRASSEPRDVSA